MLGWTCAIWIGRLQAAAPHQRADEEQAADYRGVSCSSPSSHKSVGRRPSQHRDTRETHRIRLSSPIRVPRKAPCRCPCRSYGGLYWASRRSKGRGRRFLCSRPKSVANHGLHGLALQKSCKIATTRFACVFGQAMVNRRSIESTPAWSSNCVGRFAGGRAFACSAHFLCNACVTKRCD